MEYPREITEEYWLRRSRVPPFKPVDCSLLLRRIENFFATDWRIFFLFVDSRIDDLDWARRLSGPYIDDKLSLVLGELELFQDELRKIAAAHAEISEIPEECLKVIGIVDRYADLLRENANLIKQNARAQLRIAARISRDLHARFERCQAACEKVINNNRRLRNSPTTDKFNETVDSVNSYVKELYNISNIIYRIDYEWFARARNNQLPANAGVFYRMYIMTYKDMNEQFVKNTSKNSSSPRMATVTIRNSHRTESQRLYNDFSDYIKHRKYFMDELLRSLTRLITYLSIS